MYKITKTTSAWLWPSSIHRPGYTRMMVKKNGIISQIVENIKTGISNSWPKTFVKIPASLLVNLPKSKESLSCATLFELLQEILQQSMSRASYRYRCHNKLQICPVFQAGRGVLHPTWMLPCEMPFMERNRRSYKTPMLHSTHWWRRLA